MRHREFKGTEKEIAEQFQKDLYEARTHLRELEPFSEAVMWISQGLYRIIAAYYGSNICLYSNGIATIQGIKVEKRFSDFEDGCSMFEVFAVKDGGHYPTKNGGYLYKKKARTRNEQVY